MRYLITIFAMLAFAMIAGTGAVQALECNCTTNNCLGDPHYVYAELDEDLVPDPISGTAATKGDNTDVEWRWDYTRTDHEYPEYPVSVVRAWITNTGVDEELDSSIITEVGPDCIYGETDVLTGNATAHMELKSGSPGNFEELTFDFLLVELK